MNIPVIDLSQSAAWDIGVSSSGVKVAAETVAEASRSDVAVSIDTTADLGEVTAVMAEDVFIDEPKPFDMADMISFSSLLSCDDVFALPEEDIRGAIDEASMLLKLTSGGSTTGKVLFDVYSLMALMIDCSQKMRDAAREIRQAENTQVQQTIQLQADKQRTAAIGGMIASIAVCALQVAAQSANMVYMAKGAGNISVETKSRMIGDMIAAMGNVAQGVVKSSVEIVQADATEEGAKQQQAQEMLDQAKDLFGQCQSVVEAVVHLMQSVLQAEIQSMRDAIHA
ncbi:MAG: hypothetical protein J6S30_03760 [Kiritimatiellae bacterium]|nr:hypothetical protein [Kiritimatiellia bacterium]